MQRMLNERCGRPTLLCRDSYADYWLDFEHGGTGKVEYRVWWPGDSPLSVDRIVVFRKP